MNNNIISTILLAIVYFVNYASTSWLFGQSMVNLREIFPFAYMPVWATFGIAWWMIYLALGVRLVRTWTQHGTENKVNQKILPWFWASSWLNIAWILSTAYERYSLSVIIITLLMFTLWRILQLLPRNSSYFMRIPFGLYAWWVTMATTVVWISQLLYMQWLDMVLAPWRTWIAVWTWVWVAWRVFYKRRNPAQLFITIVALIWVAFSVFSL